MKVALHGPAALLVLLAVVAGVLTLPLWWPAGAEGESEVALTLTTLHADRFYPGNLPLEP